MLTAQLYCWLSFHQSLINHLFSFRFSLAGLRRSPLAVGPSLPEQEGRAGALVAVVSTRVSPLTLQITDTTLSGGSLGSCVDEERS